MESTARTKQGARAGLGPGPTGLSSLEQKQDLGPQKTGKGDDGAGDGGGRGGDGGRDGDTGQNKPTRPTKKGKGKMKSSAFAHRTVWSQS